MQIKAQPHRTASTDTFTPTILIIETDHGMTVQGKSSELLAALDTRQVMPLFGDSFLDGGVPWSALND